MTKPSAHSLLRYANPDGAILLLRFFAGASILFYNIGKIQDYNELIGSYPALLSISPAVVFTLAALFETSLATLLLLGIRVRWVAAILAIGVLIRGFITGQGVSTADFAWAGIFLLLTLAGSGTFAWAPSGTPSD